MLKQARLKEVVSYEPTTGIFKRLTAARGTKGIGSIPGSKNKDGYIQMRIDRKRYFAHRLAWLYIHGEFPVQTDHKDHNRSNNKIDNLRNVTHRENGKNVSMNSKNKSGTTGVYYNTRERKWMAEIMVHQKKILLGGHKEKDNAISARQHAEKLYKFHDNHGKKDV